jgi:hypothetical protein
MLDVIIEKQLREIELVWLHFMSSRTPTNNQVATLEKNLRIFNEHKSD